MKTFILTALSLLTINPALAIDPMPAEERMEILDRMYESALITIRFCKFDELNIYVEEREPNTPLQSACKSFEQSYKEYIKKATYRYDWDDFLANSKAFANELRAINNLSHQQNRKSNDRPN